MFRIVKSSLQSFLNNKSSKYGLIANTLFGIGLRGVGDVIQQNIEIKYNNKNDQSNIQMGLKELNWTRTS